MLTEELAINVLILVSSLWYQDEKRIIFIVMMTP